MGCFPVMAGHLTKLAKAVRSATADEEFDLAGMNGAGATALMQSCFSSPLPLQKMVKLSFTVGAGKGARSRYDAALPKNVRSA